MRGNRYRVGMRLGNGKTLDKSFNSLEEALEYRNLVAKEYDIELKDNTN